MSADEIYRFVNLISNTVQSGRVTPDRFNLMWNRAERQLFTEKYGNPKEYKTGRPIPGQVYEQTQKISDDLRPFKTRSVVMPSSNGHIQLPPDYAHLTYLNYFKSKEEEKPIDILVDDKWASRTSSNLIPTGKYPIANLRSDHIKVVPITTRVILGYLRYPSAVAWGYTISGTTGRPVYDPANSIDSEFPDELHNDIVIKICSYLGISLSKQELAQYTEIKNRDGI